MSEDRVMDLRSDTVTLPTEEMRHAMQDAELGDDVYGEDPTVNQLEKMAAQKLGMEQALLVTSGTQGNIAALLSHTERGDEVILGEASHTFNYEVSAISVIGGLLPRPLKEYEGIFKPSQVRQAIRGGGVHHSKTGLICVENTHNMAGGIVIPPQKIQEIKNIAENYEIPVHLDGARIFNATIALGVDIREFTRHVDSIMFCLSKGLSAPVGSILAGSREFIEKARKARKMLGGGMRQAGIIAAPGIVALEKMIGRLEEDHENAKLLANKLNKIQGIDINMDRVQTNIVLADVSSLPMSPKELAQRMDKQGIKFLPLELHPSYVRLVTHRGIKREDVVYVVRKIRETIKGES